MSEDLPPDLQNLQDMMDAMIEKRRAWNDPTKPGATWLETLDRFLQAIGDPAVEAAGLWEERFRGETLSTWLTVWAVQRPKVLAARAEGYTKTRAQVDDYVASLVPEHGGPTHVEQRGILRVDYHDGAWLAFESAFAGVPPHDDCWRQLSERPALPYDTQRTVEERAGIPCEPCTAQDSRGETVYLNECLHKDMVEHLGKGARVLDQELGTSNYMAPEHEEHGAAGIKPAGCSAGEEGAPSPAPTSHGGQALTPSASVRGASASATGHPRLQPGGAGLCQNATSGPVAPASLNAGDVSSPSAGEEGELAAAGTETPSLPARITCWRVECQAEECGSVAPQVCAPLPPPLCPSCGRDRIAIYDTQPELPDPLPAAAEAFAAECDMATVKIQRAAKEARACEVCLRPVSKGESYVRRLGKSSPRRAHEACVLLLAERQRDVKPDNVTVALGTIADKSTVEDW